MKLTRRDAREAAFLFAYQRTVRSDSLQDMIDASVENEVDELRLNTFGTALITACDEHLTEIDDTIEKYLTNWKLSRLPKLTLAALRIGTAELLFTPDVPVAVTINEMIEILRKYTSDEDALFLNGVLGALVKGENIVKTEQATAEEQPEQEG